MTLATARHQFWFTPRRAEDLAICRILFAVGVLLVGLSRPIYKWGDVPAFFLQQARLQRRFDIPMLDTGVLQGLHVV